MLRLQRGLVQVYGPMCHTNGDCERQWFWLCSAAHCQWVCHMARACDCKRVLEHFADLLFGRTIWPSGVGEHGWNTDPDASEGQLIQFRDALGSCSQVLSTGH